MFIPHSFKKLNAHQKVRIPTTRDIYKRVGPRQLMSFADGQLADFGRNKIDRLMQSELDYQSYLRSLASQPPPPDVSGDGTVVDAPDA